MNPEELFRRYQELQLYVGWTDDDARRVAALAELFEPCFPALIDDFYEEVIRHPGTRRVITGGAAQIERLKGTMLGWLRELFTGRYDQDYVARRWRVGWRHVEIGLDQAYTNVALSRLRRGLVRELQGRWTGELPLLQASLRSLNTLLDLDLAIIEDAYQSEYLARQQCSERLATIGQVAGGVAHELRNPLNVVKTSVYYLMNARSIVPEKRTEHLRRIERHVMLADSVITALSNFARLPQPMQAPFSLARCIQEALETNPVPSSIEVVLAIPDDLPDALADVDQIRIVFANLIRNAREAMPEGGQLRITARGEPGGVSQGEKGGVTPASAARIEVEVSDTGVGIPPERLIQILEPLYSTKARGLGLGLAIARAILEKNQGELRVTSEVGKGSTFSVALPAREEQAATA